MRVLNQSHNFSQRYDPPQRKRPGTKKRNPSGNYGHDRLQPGASEERDNKTSGSDSTDRPESCRHARHAGQ